MIYAYLRVSTGLQDIENQRFQILRFVAPIQERSLAMKIEKIIESYSLRLVCTHKMCYY